MKPFCALDPNNRQTILCGNFRFHVVQETGEGVMRLLNEEFSSRIAPILAEIERLKSYSSDSTTELQKRLDEFHAHAEKIVKVNDELRAERDELRAVVEKLPKKEG